MNYKAKNIDVDKILDALSKQREYAREEHIKNVEKEEARYNQEIADIISFENMFKCSNYEKTEEEDETEKRGRVMAEYVKRSKVIEICVDYSEHCFDSNNSYGQDIADRILDDVSILPSADVVEVKHGQWLDDIVEGTTVAGVDFKGVVGYKCSLCGRCEKKKEPYCNCGAKMDSQ